MRGDIDRARAEALAGLLEQIRADQILGQLYGRTRIPGLGFLERWVSCQPADVAPTGQERRT